MKQQRRNQVVDIQSRRRPSVVRNLYNRCRRYLIVLWCWIRRKNPPPKDTNNTNSSSKLHDEDLPPESGPLLLQNDEQLQQQESSSIPIQFESERSEKIDLLFVGLSSSGISTTAKKLFSTGSPAEAVDNKETTDEPEIIEIISPFSTQKPFNLNIIDVPGFCKGNTVEEDAELVVALTSYLKTNLPNKIPNATFIISRFDDNRFEGEGSEFSKMLFALSHSQIHWTNSRYTNVVLVLTHAEKVKDEKDDVFNKIAKFQQVFHSIFPKNDDASSVTCVTIDNNCNSKNQFCNALSTCFSRTWSFKNFQKYIEQLQNSKHNFDDLLIHIQRTPVSTLLPLTGRREINTLLEILLQGKPDSANDYDDRIEDKSTKSNFSSYFPFCFPCTTTTTCNLDHCITKLLPEMRLLMGDGVTELSVQEIEVGDKLFSFNSKNNVLVVTGINKIVCSKSKSYCSLVGVHFYISPDYDDENDKTVFKYVKGRSSKLKEEQLDWDTFMGNRMNNAGRDLLVLHEVQVNFGESPDDTFIIDGYVVLAKNI